MIMFFAGGLVKKCFVPARSMPATLVLRCPQVVHAQQGWWFPRGRAPDHGCFESNINVVLSDDPPPESICGPVPAPGNRLQVPQMIFFLYSYGKQIKPEERDNYGKTACAGH
jgi:hypothetical protein